MKNLSFFILVFFLSFLSPAFAAYDNLYLVGNATEAGWDPDAAIPMEKQEPGIFTWTGTLSDYSIDEGRFKFLVSNKWEPSITCRIDIAGHLLVESGKEYDLYERATANDGFDKCVSSACYGSLYNPCQFEYNEDGLYRRRCDCPRELGVCETRNRS